MPVAKATKAATSAKDAAAGSTKAKAAPATRRTTRATATVTKTTDDADDDLVAEVEKLKIQPKAKAAISRTTKAAAPAASSSTSAVASGAGPSKTASTARKPTVTKASATTARATSSRTATTATATATRPAQTASTSIEEVKSKVASSSRAAQPSTSRVNAAAGPSSSSWPNASGLASVKGKEKVNPISALEASLPWAAPVIPGADGPTKSRERPKLAAAALNTSVKELGSAIQAGYKYSSQNASDSNPSPPSTLIAVPAASKIGGQPQEPWTDVRVDKLLETGRIALRVLREEDRAGRIVNKSVDLERTCQNLVTKCLGLGMYQAAMGILVESRPSILSLYTPRPIPFIAIKKPQTGPSTSKLTVKGGTNAGSLSAGSGLPKEWIDLARLSVPKDGTELSEPLRAVLFLTLIHAWISLVVLCKDPTELPPILFIPAFPSQSMSENLLHPLCLALTLPQAQTAQPLYWLYRQIGLRSIPTMSPSFLHLRQLSFISLSFTLSSAPGSKAEPKAFWATIHRTLFSFLKGDEEKERLAEAAKVIGDLVDWSEKLVEQRKERGWFEGKAWLDLVEMWIGLGRRLGDSAIIDKPLALLASGASLETESATEATATTSAPSFVPADSVTPATPLPTTTPPASIPCTPSAQNSSGTPLMSENVIRKPVRIPRKISNPTSEITRISGDLAKASLAFDKALSSKSTTPLSAIGGLRHHEVVTLAEAVCSLADDSERSIYAGKAVRAWERVRRSCCKALELSAKTEHAAFWANVLDDLRRWLNSSVNATELLMESGILDSDLTRDLMCGVVDAVLTIHRTDFSASLPDLIRMQALLDISYPLVKTSNMVECLRCLATIAYNGAVALWRQPISDKITEMSALSCAWSVKAIDLVQEAIQANPSADDKATLEKAISSTRSVMSKRWELLAGCYQKGDNRLASYTAYSRCLASQTPDIISKLASASAVGSTNDVFTSLTELSSSLSRVAGLAIFDPSSYATHGSEMIQFMREAGYPAAAIGAIGEKLLELIQEIEWKEEGAKLCFEITDALLEVYDANYPIRRIRVLAEMMMIIGTSGQKMDEFPAFTEEVDRLALQTNLGADSALAPYKSEYMAYTLILRAMQAYHSSSSPSTIVIQASQEALKSLRSIVLPPTATPSTPSHTVEGKKKVPLGRSTTTKAVPSMGTSRAVSEPKVASKKGVATKTVQTATKTKRRSSVAPMLVSDNLRKLTRLLGSLASLLGLLGHTLRQIEALKLLRAFLRNREDLIDDYIKRSGQLATEYHKLGKISRAGFVFTQALRSIENSKGVVSPRVKVELLCRQACYLASKGDVHKAQDAYTEAAMLEKDIEALNVGTYYMRVIDRCETLERGAWARRALACIYAAQDNASGAILQLTACFRLFSRASDGISRVASVYPTADDPKAALVSSDDPFGAPPPKSQSAKPAGSGADEPSKDAQTAQKPNSQSTQLQGKHLYSEQWHIASSLLSTLLELSSAMAYRGSAREAEYFLRFAGDVARVVKSDVFSARVGAREAELYFRMRKWEESGQKLEAAAGHLDMIEGPDMIDLNRLKGDLYTRTEMAEEAGEVFENTSKEIAGLDAVFTAAEAVIPSPRKNALLAASTSSIRASLTPSKVSQEHGLGAKEPLLPITLAHVLRQHAWLLREAGSREECDILLSQIKTLPSNSETKTEGLLLEGRIALHEAFNTFKTDLFMSSLTESAVAMPMGNPTRRPIDRQSTRLSIQSVLTRAEDAFLSALSLASGSGKIEGIRQACLALALLRAFQTSLGQGSDRVTASAADILASSSSITLQREMLEAIECKFVDVVTTDTTWPSLIPEVPDNTDDKMIIDSDLEVELVEMDDLDDYDGKLRSYWDSIKAKYMSNPIVSAIPPSLDSLPLEWVVISINVTDDHNTMFISRQQRNCEPIVFCLPLDRQGRREGDTDDLWTFDAAVAEFQDIISCSNECARNAKNVVTKEGRLAWWDERHGLDNKMKELCESLEFVWLGAFKTIFSSRPPAPTIGSPSSPIIDDFRTCLEKIFDSALSSTSGGGLKNPRGRPSSSAPQVHLEDSLLECFARLPSKAKDEEIEDLVYFVLDVYQFHGVPVALSELDIDQIAIDVKSALEKTEQRFALAGDSEEKNEHIFLALDKNVQRFPWESIPILRGRAVSRVPSLSFLLDQVAMGAHLRPSLTQTTVHAPSKLSIQIGEEEDTRRTVNSRRTFYILNPSGDLARTEQHFKPWINEMVAQAGWKGVIGRPPTELEMAAALKDYDFVIYIGHGGAEQYIRSHKIRNLPQCATTMLWGCSSGNLKDQGDLDCAGTAWNYMLAGCPSLTANLWDVTDRDIDKLSMSVFKSLHLDTAHVPESKARPNTLLPLSELSTVQAVNGARNECKLTYLTGAAPVVYGLPVYLH